MTCVIYPSVLASEASTLDCDQYCLIFEQWLWWRGNRSASRTWYQRWKREKWIRVLSTRTYSDSLGNGIEDAWILSAAEFPASHSVPLVVGKPQKIQDTYGPTSKQASLFSDRAFVSSKMSTGSPQPNHQDTTRFSTMSSATWRKWVIERRQDSSQRRKLVHRTCESGGSSWPTATARDWKDGNNPSQNVPTNGLLGRAVPRDPTSRPGQLNPDWVDTLMGFQTGWTDLGHWATQ